MVELPTYVRVQRMIRYIYQSLAKWKISKYILEMEKKSEPLGEKTRSRTWEEDQVS